MDDAELSTLHFDLSPQQRWLWLWGQGRGAFAAQAAYAVRGEVDVDRLRRAAGAVAGRHEILRTTFPLPEWSKVPRQKVEEGAAPRWKELDAGEPPAGQSPAELLEWLRAEPFELTRQDVSTSPATGLFAGLFTLAWLPACTPASGPALPPLLLLHLSALCADERSAEILIAEIAAEYRADGEGRGEESEPFQYGDFAAWQNELLANPDAGLEEARAVWAGHDPAAPRPLLPAEVPAADPAAPGTGFTPRRAPLPLADGVGRQLSALAARHDLPVGSLFHAAFETLLWRRLRLPAPEVPALGRLFDGRKFEELEGGLGLYSRALPVTLLRAGDPRNAASFLARAERLAGAVHELAGWQEYGPADEDEPAAGGGPRFAFLVDHRAHRLPASLPLAGGPGSDAALVPLDRFTCTEPFVLRLSSWSGEGGNDAPDGREAGSLVAGAELLYDASRLPAATARLLAGELAALLARAAAAPELSPAGLSPLSAAALHRILVELNDTAAAAFAEPPHLVHQRIARWAEMTPDAPAVTFEDRRLTYGELVAHAHHLAHHLRQMGVGPERRVALYAERCPEAVVGIIGTLAAGGAYLPLDPGFPPERLAGMLRDADPVLILTLKALEEKVSGHGVPVLPLDELLRLDAGAEMPAGILAAYPDSPPAVNLAPENLAYLLFTSGSTGRPKGVAVEHRQLTAYLDAVIPQLEALPGGSEGSSLRGAGFALISTLAADLGHTVLFPALVGGGCLHLVSPRQASSPPDLAELFARHRVDFMKIVPSHLAALAAGIEAERIRPRRGLVLGGEAASWELARRFSGPEGEGALLNHYGPTETTVGVATTRIDPRWDATAAKGGVLPLGHPLPGCRAVLVDAGLRPVPPFAAGELLVGGLQVTRGYLGRPALTAERFVPDPFAGVGPGAWPGARLYKSGDLARQLPDGRLAFLGRVDHQVKIRGFRIELGEIEAVLCSHPGIAQAVVLARADERGEPRLVAYLVAAAGSSLPDREALEGFLAPRLPDTMQPAALVPLPALPLTANGKLDRAALPEPESATVARREYVAPRTEVEKTLGEIWEAVLRVERVGVNDNFFSMGGDSILVIQVVARAHQAGLRFNPRDLFQYQTPAELATVVEIRSGGDLGETLPEGPLPLTPIQRWFFEQDHAEAHHWNQSLLLEVHQPLEPRALAAALEAVVAHHDALRLRFTPTPAGWRQHYAPEPSGEAAGESFPLACVDLTSISPGVVPAAIEVASSGLQRGFDLTAGPLAAALYFDLGDGDAGDGNPDGDDPDSDNPAAAAPGRLLLVAHHLVIDGVSWQTLLLDLAQAYEQALDGRAISLSPRTTSYGRWAQQLQAATLAGHFDDEVDYWRGALAEPLLPLPADPAGGDGLEASSRSVESALSREETASLLADAHTAYRTEINDLLLAALALAVNRWTTSPVVAVELEGHGREELTEGVDVSRTVGWFTTHFPVYLRAAPGGVDRGLDLGGLLTAVKEQLRRIPRRGFGFGALRALRGGEIEAELRSLPRPQIGFNYLGQLDRALPAGGLFRPAAEPIGPAHSPAARRAHPLSVTVRVLDGRLRARFSYGEGQLRRATVEALADGYIDALRALLAHCLGAEAGGFTPSDFGLVDLDLDQLEAIASSVDTVKS